MDLQINLFQCLSDTERKTARKVTKGFEILSCLFTWWSCHLACSAFLACTSSFACLKSKKWIYYESKLTCYFTCSSFHELKWLGCKLSMVGSPFWIGKTGNNSVYGEVAEMGKGSRKSSLATWSTGTFHDRRSTIDSPAIHIKTALIQSPHIPIERTLHRAFQVVHFRGGVRRELLDTWYQAGKSK